MAAILRTFSGGLDDLESMLMPTFAAFWPWEYSPLVVVLDAESPVDAAEAAKLLLRYPWVRVRYQAAPARGRYCELFPAHFSDRGRGYDRQQYDTFFLDLHSNAAVLAIMDADAALSGFVTPDAVFSPGGRPQDGGLRLQVTLNARPGHEFHVGVSQWALGGRIRGDGMCFFPVFVWRDTLLGFRRTLVKRHAVADFDAFMDLLAKHTAYTESERAGNPPPGVYSQFVLLLHYAWEYERDRYDFRIEGAPEPPPSASDTTGRWQPEFPPDPPDVALPRLHLAQHKPQKGSMAARLLEDVCAAVGGGEPCGAGGFAFNDRLTHMNGFCQEGSLWCTPWGTPRRSAEDVQRAHAALSVPVARQRLVVDHHCGAQPSEDWNQEEPPMRCSIRNGAEGGRTVAWSADAHNPSMPSCEG